MNKEKENNNSCCGFGGSEGWHRADCPNAVSKNTGKQELLNNPLVKEIFMDAIQLGYNKGKAGEDTEEYFDEYVRSQQPPKEWQVVAYKSKNNNSIYIRNEDGRFFQTENSGCFIPEQAFIQDKDFIWSVKRLSDGEVFTVGDETNKGRIESIAIINPIGILTLNIRHDIGVIGYSIREVEKKIPLFTTEDGVGIFKGTRCFCVATQTGYAQQTWVPCDIYVEYSGYDSSLKFFSTKDAAEEWILMNKPVITLSECLKVIREVYEERPNARPIDTAFVLEESIKELAKSQMK